VEGNRSKSGRDKPAGKSKAKSQKKSRSKRG